MDQRAPSDLIRSISVAHVAHQPIAVPDDDEEARRQVRTAKRTAASISRHWSLRFSEVELERQYRQWFAYQNNHHLRISACLVIFMIIGSFAFKFVVNFKPSRFSEGSEARFNAGWCGMIGLLIVGIGLSRSKKRWLHVWAPLYFSFTILTGFSILFTSYWWKFVEDGFEKSTFDIKLLSQFEGIASSCRVAVESIDARPETFFDDLSMGIEAWKDRGDQSASINHLFKLLCQMQENSLKIAAFGVMLWLCSWLVTFLLIATVFTKSSLPVTLINCSGTLAFFLYTVQDLNRNGTTLDTLMMGVPLMFATAVCLRQAYRTECTSRQEFLVWRDLQQQVQSLVRCNEISPEELQRNEFLGDGSFGEVFKGRWQGLEVAIKDFRYQENMAGALRSFSQEAAVAMRLHHPHVVLLLGISLQLPDEKSFHAHDTPNKDLVAMGTGRVSLVMELMPKGTLFSCLRGNPIKTAEGQSVPEWSFEFPTLLQMLVDVARGLVFLHNLVPPIIHGDIKSPNVLVADNWLAKIGDFGLSRISRGKEVAANPKKKNKSGQTQDAEVVTHASMIHCITGSPLWAAPEVLVRKSAPSVETDIYSFGMVLWEVLHPGELPWCSPEDAEPGGRPLELPALIRRVVALQQRPRVLRKLPKVLNRSYTGSFTTTRDIASNTDSQQTSKEEDEARLICIDVMTQCWDAVPSRRIRFPIILRRLEDALSRLRVSKPVRLIAAPSEEDKVVSGAERATGGNPAQRPTPLSAVQFCTSVSTETEGVISPTSIWQRQRQTNESLMASSMFGSRIIC